MKKLLIAFLLLASVCGAQTLTVPDLTSQMPKFFAYSTANNPIGTIKAASYTAVVYDTHSGFDGVATYTIPVAGYYRVIMHNSATFGGAGQFISYLYKNGSSIAYDNCRGDVIGIFGSTNFDFVLLLAKDDKLSGRVLEAAGGSMIGDTVYKSWFSVVKIP
jgi:hypothetical protein